MNDSELSTNSTTAAQNVKKSTSSATRPSIEDEKRALRTQYCDGANTAMLLAYSVNNCTLLDEDKHEL